MQDDLNGLLYWMLPQCLCLFLCKNPDELWMSWAGWVTWVTCRWLWARMTWWVMLGPSPTVCCDVGIHSWVLTIGRRLRRECKQLILIRRQNKVTFAIISCKMFAGTRDTISWCAVFSGDVSGGLTDGSHWPGITSPCSHSYLCLKKFHPKVRNYGEGPY